MQMDEYLREIRHAAEQLISLIWAEAKSLDEASAKLRRLTAETEAGYESAASIDLNAEDSDDVMMGVGRRFETYFGPDRDRQMEVERTLALEAAVQTRDFSRRALAGALLQFGKQGIAIVHGELRAAPVARALGSTNLRDVVWQGRNQGLHWEAQDPYPAVKACFEALNNHAGVPFDDPVSQNLAFAVVELLGWTDWQSFEADMMSLA